LAVVLMIVGAGAIWWAFPSQDDASSAETMLPDGLKNLDDLLNEQQATTDPQTLDGQVTGQDSNLSADQTDTVAGSNAAVTDDQANLPQEVNGEGLTVGRNDEGQRVVLPDDVVDAIINEQDAGGDGTQAVEEPLASEINQAIPAPATPDEPSDLTQSQNITASSSSETTSTETGSTAAATSENRLSFDAQALLDVPAQRYALQLAALQSRQDATDFIADYQLGDRVQVYQTRRNNADWYMVLLGDYASVTDARRAELTLADNVRALQPFVKSFSQVHREINRANGQ
jgi:Uncharacterized protein conserved in bacteria